MGSHDSHVRALQYFFQASSAFWKIFLVGRSFAILAVANFANINSNEYFCPVVMPFSSEWITLIFCTRITDIITDISQSMNTGGFDKLIIAL